MKKFVIGALICLNVALVLALFLGSGNSSANAQAGAVRGPGEYMLMTGFVDQDLQAVYIVDIAKRKIAALTMDRAKKKLSLDGGRDLRKDFNRVD